MHNHECPRKGCTVQVPFEKLACTRHWKLVSRATQNAVYKAWRTGDPQGHLDAREAAVEEINRL